MQKLIYLLPLLLPVWCIQVPVWTSAFSTVVTPRRTIHHPSYHYDQHPLPSLSLRKKNAKMQWQFTRDSSLSSVMEPTSTLIHSAITTTKKENLALAGKVFFYISRFHLTPEKMKRIKSALKAETDYREIAILLTMAFVLPVLGRFAHNIRLKIGIVKREYKETKLRHIARHISQGFFIAAMVYFADCFSEVLLVLGFNSIWVSMLGKNFSNAAYSLWALQRIKGVKNYILEKTVFVTEPDLKVQNFYRKITSLSLYLITAILVVDTLHIKYASLKKALVGFSGASTFLFSWASKDLATDFLGGVTLSLAQPFQVGDKIRWEGNAFGTVERISLFTTNIRGPDEVTVEVPNSVLNNQGVFNMSTAKSSQVKQVIQYNRDHINEIPQLVEAIKGEIIKACPRLIKDGSRPFRVHWVNIGSNALEIEIDCRFYSKPESDEFYESRQSMLEAIARASEKCGIAYA